MIKKKWKEILSVLCLFLCASAFASAENVGGIDFLKVTITGVVRQEHYVPVVTIGPHTYTLVGLMPMAPAKHEVTKEELPALGPFGTGSDKPPFDPPEPPALPANKKLEDLPRPVTSAEIHLLLGKRVTLTGFLPKAKNGGFYFVVLSYELK